MFHANEDQFEKCTFFEGNETEKVRWIDTQMANNENECEYYSIKAALLCGMH